MSKGNRHVYQLARLAKREDHDVIAIARAAGIEVRSGNDLVPSDRIDLLEKLLGIDRWALSSLPEIRAHQPVKQLLVEPEITVPKPRLPKWPTVGQPTDRIFSITADQVARFPATRTAVAMNRYPCASAHE